MICLHCGYCCKHLAAVIVDDPEKGLSEDNIKLHRGNGEPCQHLIGDTVGEYSCGIHDYPWYPKTPCYDYTQIEPDINTNCRMGEYQMKEKEENNGF